MGKKNREKNVKKSEGLIKRFYSRVTRMVDKAAGYDIANYAIAESWNGTAWTEVGDLNTARRGAAAGKQSSTAGLVFGGFITAVTALNEAWNGSAWTEVADLNTASAFKAGAGTQASALAATGDPNATEEFTLPVETSETITTS